MIHNMLSHSIFFFLPSLTQAEILPDMLWDGKTDNSAAAGDGRYSYIINSTDLAGNKMDTKTVEGIILDTSMSEVVFKLSDTSYSPNNDGIKDTIVAAFGQKTENAVVSWKVSMSDSNGNIILEQDGRDSGIYEVVLDGRGAQGEVLPEGLYNLGFLSEYENGVRILKKEVISLDLTPPVVSFNIENPVFSPNGSGNKDTTEISMKSDKNVNWKGVVKNNDGEVIFEISSKDTTSLIVWDGKDIEGDDLPDGDYYLETYFEDLAGNPLTPERQKVTIDRNNKKASLVNIPGACKEERNLKGIAFFSVESDGMDNIEKWTFKISDADGNVLYEDAGSEILPEIISVPGERDDAPEGYYNVSFNTVYKNGSESEDSFKFFYDLTPPEADLAITATPFAVNNDVLDGEVVFDPNAKDESGIYKWVLTLTDSSGEEGMVEGKGLSDNGIVLYGEDYLAEEVKALNKFDASLKLIDMNGNSTVVEGNFVIEIIANLVDGRYYIMVPKIIFSAYKHTLHSRGKAAADENMKTIKKVAELFKKYPGYTIVLEGHALNVFYDSINGKKTKEEKVLVPLTERRAEAVRKALFEQGVPEDSIKIEYFGGSKPEASVSNRSIRWKNRRVEFAIEK